MARASGTRRYGSRASGMTKTTVLAAGSLFLLALAGCQSLSGRVAGSYVPHPNPGIAQIECPPPARPECLPGHK